MRSFVSLLLALSGLACSPPPPPHWAEGGAPLVLGPAHWDRADDDPIDLDAQGRVLEGGTLRFIVDNRGRIVDDDDGAVAVLFPQGELVGPSNQFLGRIGVANAAPPHRDVAWLAVMPDGTVQYFDDEGDRSQDGRWRGCEGARHRTCTLVTHLIALRRYRHGSPRVGVGIGVMVPIR